MTEMTTTAQNSDLQDAFQELFSILTKPTQQLLLKHNNFEKPKPTIKGSSIEIENWPSNQPYLERNIIEKICHDLKHLYAHGDRSGRKGIKVKEDQKQNLQNNKFRMCISYTYSSIEESAKTPRKLIVRFLVSRTEQDFPRTVVTWIDLNAIQKEDTHFRYLGENLYLDPAIKRGHEIAIVKRMTEQEENQYLAKFIAQCNSEIKQEIYSAYKFAVNSGKSGHKVFPDYSVIPTN